jgi:hypothetical protein
MSLKYTDHEETLFMCTDSEKQIAKLEWFNQYGKPEDPTASQQLKNLLQTMKDMHATLEQLYEKPPARDLNPK